MVLQAGSAVDYLGLGKRDDERHMAKAGSMGARLRGEMEGGVANGDRLTRPAFPIAEKVIGIY